MACTHIERRILRNSTEELAKGNMILADGNPSLRLNIHACCMYKSWHWCTWKGHEQIGIYT